MSEHVPLAELTEAVLDAPTLDALLADIGSLAEVLEVVTKGAEQVLARPAPLSLVEAVQLLRAGRLRGVQVRYRWNGEEWLDTLLRGEVGIRIVRLTVTASEL